MADSKTPATPRRKAKKPAARKTGAKAATARAKPATPRKAGATRKAATARTSSARAYASETATKWRGEATRMADSAADTAKSYARDGKDKAASAIAGLARYIEDNAVSVDDRLGAQYGDYARTAAASIASFATTVEEQDVDEIVKNTREFVRKSPAIAIGAAAVAGFIVARLARGPSSQA